MPGSFPSKNTAIFPPLAAWQPGQPAPPGHIENRTRSNRTGTATAGPCLLNFRYRKPGGDELRKPQGAALQKLKADFSHREGTNRGQPGEFPEQNAGDFPHPIQALKQEGSKRTGSPGTSRRRQEGGPYPVKYQSNKNAG